MGYSLAWLAVRGIPYDAALERLRLAPSGEAAEYPESNLSARRIPNDWILVVGRGCDHRIIAENQLATLSSDCEVVACSIEEHVMYSSSEVWSRGQRQWRVVHDAQENIDHLPTFGDPPEDFSAIRARFAQAQSAEGASDTGVDFYFEIPLALAQARVGFKHDEASELTDGEFQVLTDISMPSSGSMPSSKPWRRFWR